MSQGDVQKIKDRLGIEEVVGGYIKLEKAGKNLKACCPFHNEKTPSFMVSPDRGSYYCFGCHKGGDIFSFVQEFEGVEFREALKILADQAGITITQISKEDSDKYDRIRKVLEISCKFYEIHLSRNSDVIEYLKSRGLTNETIKEFRLGYVPKGWDNLYSFLQKKGFTDQEILDSGMVKKGDKGKIYDRFRSRIIFPISDSTGKVVAFTGRIFNPEGDEAKYLNSPETVLFDKSRVLYGYDIAKKNIRKLDFSILVEGQMDLIMAHQAGYANTVASSGTALTKEHLEMINRISEKLVIAYDSDGAGFRASEKAWQLALSLGMDVKLAKIPKDMDPADLILKSKDEWKEAVKNSRHIIEVITDQIKDETDDMRERGKMVSQKLIPYLNMIQSKIDQSYFVKLVGDMLGIDEKSIALEISSGKSEVVEIAESVDESISDVLIENIGMIFWLNTLDKYNESKYVENVKDILGDKYETSIHSLESRKEELIFSIEERYEKSIDKLDDVTEDLVLRLKLKKLGDRRNQYMKELKVLENNSDEDGVKDLLKKIQEISNEIGNLRG